MRMPSLALTATSLTALLGLVLLATSVMAQVDTGTILGTVKDVNGAVISQARVTLVNTGTSVAFNTETDSDGRYIFPAIKIGLYQVTVESRGFKKAVRSGIQLNIQQQAEINITLETGEISQMVEVSGEAPLLQTQESSVGQSIDATTINNLPLNGRDWTNLARLSAGVNLPQNGARASNQFAANGTRPAQNSYMLDGIDNNTASVDFLAGRADVVRPPVDAIGEVKIQTNGFSAEFGRAGGAVMQATTKSGTNQFHGSAWDFIRNDIFDANSFNNNWQGVEKAPLRQNQFGATLGGPIWKNRTFFFADFEGLRVRRGRVWSASVPTALEKASGYTDYSDLITRLGNRERGTDLLGRKILQGTIFDPATTRQVIKGQVDPVTGLTAADSGFVRDPFPGNKIPADRLNQNAVKLLDLYPAENFIQAGTAGGNYITTRKLTDDRNQFDVRIDHNFSDKDQIFGRYSFADFNTFRPGPFEGIADGGAFEDGNETNRIWGLAISHTHTFANSMLNEARFGISREHTYRNPPSGDDTSDIPGDYGIPGIPQVKGNGGLPPLNIGGLSRLGAVTWLVSDRFSNTTQFTDNLTKNYKSHTFKGGVQVQHTDFPWIAPPFSRGNFQWGGGFTSAPGLGDGATGRAQFLLDPVAASVPGGVSNVGGLDLVQASPFGGVDNNRQYYAAYFQDDWKVSPSLTLNLGLRWEHFSLTGESNYAQANFVPDPINPRYVIPTSRKDNPKLSQAFVDALAANKIALVYSDEFGSGLGLAQKKNFAPRFGFAYKVTERLVARGGYGIYYGAFENRGGFPNLGYNYPFQFDFTFRAPNDSSSLIYPDGTQGTLERGLLGVPLDPTKVNPGGLNLRG
ncbi:MAG TPA: TonB-dependent receptor, partial [Blastocatellia bacterium]